MSEEKKLNGTVIVTYRCNARCSMCNRYKAPSKPEEEISIETIKKLPKMYFTNITGGEPFIRTDLKDIVRELYKKSDRIVISTNGLINYIYGQKRLLPCDMSFDTFFIDPYGDVMPCNGTKDKEVMGNLNNQTWDELWNSPEAEKVRAKVRCCDRDCWMIGSVSPAMHKYIWKPATWVLVHKFKASRPSMSIW